MFVRKQRRTATVGITTQSYSNTNQTNNTPVIEVAEGGDLNHLNPTLTQPPNNPDTITPVVTPETGQINLLLPVGGFVGTVYVVLTKPTPNAAVVVVEATNDAMFYDEKTDVNPVGKIKSGGAVELDDGYTFSQQVFNFILQNVEANTITAFKNCLAPYDEAVLGNGLYAAAQLIINKAKPEFKKASYIRTTNGESVGEVVVATCFSNVNFVTLNYGNSSTSGLVEIPKFIINDSIEPVQIDMGETVNIQNEVYNTVGNAAKTVTLPVLLYIEYNIRPLVDDDSISSVACYIIRLDVIVKYTPAEYCHPQVESLDVDPGTTRIVDEYYFGAGKSKINVRRGYTNIGGKIKHLYTVKATNPTEVFVNYDGTNYGVIVQTPDQTAIIKQGKITPTASYTNNINGYNLNAAQQTLLQTCLPIPDDTLQGGFKVFAPTTEVNFKSYGFKSIFYRTATAYNNTTIKGCAVYGL